MPGRWWAQQYGDVLLAGSTPRGRATTSRRTGARSFTAVSYATPHFTDISIYEDRLVLRAVNRDALVIDEAVLLP